MLFIELTLKNEKKCTIQINKISCIYVNSKDECIVDTGQEGEYNVLQTYEEVVRMIQYYDEVKWVSA
jgi:hypothetical protein